MDSTPADTTRFQFPRYVLLLSIFVSPSGSGSRDDDVVDWKPVQELAQELGIYLLSFDRPGYGESDPHPARTEKSIALDIAELADNLQLGPKFHLIGFSMGGEIMWSCLKYIPQRQGVRPLSSCLLSEQSVVKEYPGLNISLSCTVQALRCGHSRPRRQLLVVRLAVERVVGRLVPAAPAGPVGCLGVSSLAVADILVEQPETVPGLQCHRIQPGSALRGRQVAHPQIRLQNLHGNYLLLARNPRADQQPPVCSSFCAYGCCSRRSGSRGSTSACTAT